jgi:small subunit ribosomal protein S4
MRDNKCKICRRYGQKLFLKGDKCFTPKCPLARQSFSARKENQSRGRRRVSEYGRQLAEKQKLRLFYGLKEKQFRRYIEKVLKSSAQEGRDRLLIQQLESRLDNIVYRLAFADSRGKARQLVIHGHFLVNGKKVDRPSYLLKLGDKVTVKEGSKKMAIFQEVGERLKKREAPTWLQINPKVLEGGIMRWPTLEEINPPANIPTIFEFYSR